MLRTSPEKSVTLADLAKAAGVSKGTASNVFNRPKIVRKEVRDHVLGVAKAMGYHGPDPKGRLLSAGKVNAIGVATVMPLGHFFEDPFARVMMTGIAEACDASGTGISLVSAANEEQLAWNVRNAVVDGFILFCLDGGTWLQIGDAIVSGIVFTGSFALLFGGARITGWRLLDIAAPLSVAVLAVLPNRIGLVIAVVLALVLIASWSRRTDGMQRENR